MGCSGMVCCNGYSPGVGSKKTKDGGARVFGLKLVGCIRRLGV
jgi:hypothetical protein